MTYLLWFICGILVGIAISKFLFPKLAKAMQNLAELLIKIGTQVVKDKLALQKVSKELRNLCKEYKHMQEKINETP